MQRRLQDELKQSKPFATLEEEVYLEIQRTAQLAARWVAEALKPSELTPSQFNVLRILRGSRPTGLSATAIAERMVNHDPDLTRLLDRLEAAGLIAKSRDDRDRRVVRSQITAKGLSKVESASQAVSQSVGGALRSLGARKLETLADLLELVRSSEPTNTNGGSSHASRKGSRTRHGSNRPTGRSRRPRASRQES